MRYLYWTHLRKRRLFVILFATVVDLLLLSLNAQYAFMHYTANISSSLWIFFGFSALTSLMFLSIGSLVWLYARNRPVALILFSFSMSMMVLFSSETGSALGNVPFEVLTGSCSLLAIPLFSTLLLLFPRNHLSLPFYRDSALENNSQPGPRPFLIWCLRCYLLLLTVVNIILLPLLIFSLLTPNIPFWWNTLIYADVATGLTGILIIIYFSYNHSSSLRERQQLRWFVGGVILTVAPVLLLTVLPQALGLPFVDGQYSSLTALVFPLTLGYSILRYQILVFDTYIRRATTWTIGAICLAVLAYLTIAICSVFFSGRITIYVICVASTIAVLAPCTWWLAKATTERIFFSEIRHYRRLIEKPHILTDEVFDIGEAAQLFTSTAIHTFETQQICLFVLDESHDYYQLFPGLRNDRTDAPREALVQSLFTSLKAPSKNVSQLEAHLPAVERLAAARRPLLLREVITPPEEAPSGLDRYLAPSLSLEGDHVLLAPVRAQGKMIGILALGERGDHQSYAGPDFEAVQLLVTRFSSLLETARLYVRSSQYTALLNSLSSASTMPEYMFNAIDEVASTYAVVAASAVTAGTEIWLYEEQCSSLRCVTSAGLGPRLTSAQSLQPTTERDWSSCFFRGQNIQELEPPSSLPPPCLQQVPDFPFVWLPLQKGGHRVGVLVLTYSGPHIFARNEKRALEMFASQCAAALENARITLELRAAYERQKELDRLKDQFIMTASHELRTPLTAVQGYIELLSEHMGNLSAETRADFVAKARRSCDELSLMVNNIMDASRVHIDAENVRIEEIVLLEPIVHVLEILEALIKREKRTVSVMVSSDIFVMADDMRLRQVLLNLIGNALKYSPAGTSIEIAAQMDEQQAHICVRDYGSGVLPEDQSRLFERFVRLDRDINSPTRGAGLGLYICKRLVEAMGGQIWVESSGHPGTGSTFVFTLPLAIHVHTREAELEYQQPDLPLV
ncbi:MAG TPA: ATP-binding protein [Ktedonobacteraceae bacterium]|nr:ATP-binding protein [Ktedonobacteraceae bacterium]